jgi:hypothetical protein
MWLPMKPAPPVTKIAMTFLPVVLLVGRENHGHLAKCLLKAIKPLK